MALADDRAGGDRRLRTDMLQPRASVRSSVVRERQLDREPSAPTGSALDRE